MTLERRLHDAVDDIASTVWDTKGLTVRIGAILPDLIAGTRAVLKLHAVAYDNVCAVCRDDDGYAIPYPCPTVSSLAVALQVKQ